MDKKSKFIVIVDDATRKKIVGFHSDMPLGLALAMIAASDDVPPMDMVVMSAKEVGLTECAHPECVAKRARAGTMDPTLRARTECPNVVGESGELGAMLSILSEKVAAKKNGGR